MAEHTRVLQQKKGGLIASEGDLICSAKIKRRISHCGHGCSGKLSQEVPCDYEQSVFSTKI